MGMVSRHWRFRRPPRTLGLPSFARSSYKFPKDSVERTVVFGSVRLYVNMNRAVPTRGRGMNTSIILRPRARATGVQWEMGHDAARSHLGHQHTAHGVCWARPYANLHFGKGAGQSKLQPTDYSRMACANLATPRSWWCADSPSYNRAVLRDTKVQSAETLSETVLRAGSALHVYR